MNGTAGIRGAAGRAAVCAAMLVLLVPAAAVAGQVVISPGKLRTVKSSQPDTRQPFAVGNQGAGVVRFWVSVRLPVGAVVKRVVYQHAADGAAGTTAVELRKVRSVGDEFRELVVATAGSSEDTGAPYNFTRVSAPASPARAKVRAGWRYGIEATVGGTGASIGRIKVIYLSGPIP